jgi:hypothetical protein
MPVIPATGERQAEDHEFEASPGKVGKILSQKQNKIKLGAGGSCL